VILPADDERPAALAATPTGSLAAITLTSNRSQFTTTETAA